MTDFERCQRVFVYGTLMRSGSNAWRMANASFVGEAQLNGELYRIDWYPGVVLSDSKTPVFGEVFELKSADHLSELDAYEGSEYGRVIDKTSTGLVWVWEYQRETASLERLESGRWT